MNDYSIKKINNQNFEYVVLSLSYITPLEKREELEKELKKKNFCGSVLLDMLIPYGNSYNRYLSINFDGYKLDFNSIKVLYNITNDIKKISSNYYQENVDLINPFTLSTQEKYKISKGIPL